MILLHVAVEITLIVLASLAALWIALLIVNLIFVSSFNSIFKKHKKAIPVVLLTKRELIANLISVMKSAKISVDNRLVALLNDVNADDFLEPGSEQFERGKNTLSYLRDELFFAANQHPELNDNFEFVQVKKNINDTDIQYRNTVAMYNADVLGYNYWISFLPCRFVFKLFRVKQKQIIP